MEEKLTKRLYELYIQHPEVTTDSRRCPAGSMFFALKGESFDGNRFASKALEVGSAVAVVDNPNVVPEGDKRYVVVPDTLQALQALAAHHRKHFKGPVLQVTGTNGKTTTKELLAAVLSRRYRVLYTQGNLNNHIGVPLTLLRLRPEHELAIIETGANHPGEIAFLTDIVQPDYGLITNVGRAHIEGFGSFEGVKRTKGELYDYLAQKGTAHIFINTSNRDLCSMLAERGIDTRSEKCIAYGHENAGEDMLCRGAVVSCNPMLCIRWEDKQRASYEAATQLIGDYNLDNVLAAVAAGLHFGVSVQEINKTLEDYHPSLGRSEYRKTAHNKLIIDAYNANFTSMQAALENFKKIEQPGKMVILGDMKELGHDSAEAHQQVADLALKCGIQTAWFIGEEFAKALATMKIPPTINVQSFDHVQTVIERIKTEPPTDKLILIKGSNSTKLHQLPDLL